LELAIALIFPQVTCLYTNAMAHAGLEICVHILFSLFNGEIRGSANSAPQRLSY